MQAGKYQNAAVLMDEAFLRLLEKEDPDQITVKEICEKAGVNRTTFYRHYGNVNDLLEETICLINKRFTDSLTAVDDAGLDTEVLTKEKYLRPYLTLVKEHKKAYRVIRKKGSLFNTRGAFDELYRTLFSPALTHFGVSEKEKKYVLAFYTQGTMAVIGEWVDGDCEDDMDMIIDLIIKHTLVHENTSKAD
ncbi:TetR/AcrR family transcriptional regulator [Lactobacillus delbrueckii]|uniref:TetR/AcrR family transcriptional regulator n=1 Tax=Lactobacillus delbrueckii TaxID=1584 RepID=UPI0039968D0B